ncbi:hypothetical protein V8F20_001810 [Naviculisporaceae sp. PSN 640]
MQDVSIFVPPPGKVPTREDPNDRWVTGNNHVCSSKINTLKLHCKILSLRGQSAAPAISGDYAYYPGWNGSLVALKYENCKIKWSMNRSVSRTSPQTDNLQGVLYFGTLSHALLVAVDLNTGAFGLVSVGVGSQEDPAEFIANLRGILYDCCTFIGNAAVFRFTRIGSTGIFSTIWNITTIPTKLPRMGSNRLVFFATGNVMSIPDSYIPCSQSDDPGFLPEYIWQEAVFALDILTGRNDVDFGMGPSFLKGNSQTPRKRDIVTIGQKSGIVYGLRADNGQIQWSTITCPLDECPWKLSPGNLTEITSGLFGVVSHLDGSITWQTLAPLANLSLLPVTVVNDLVLTGATGNVQFNNQNYGTGTFIVLNKTTGQIILEYPLDQVFQGCIVVQGQYIMLVTAPL